MGMAQDVENAGGIWGPKRTLREGKIVRRSHSRAVLGVVLRSALTLQRFGGTQMAGGGPGKIGQKCVTVGQKQGLWEKKDQKSKGFGCIGLLYIRDRD